MYKIFKKNTQTELLLVDIFDKFICIIYVIYNFLKFYNKTFIL